MFINVYLVVIWGLVTGMLLGFCWVGFNRIRQLVKWLKNSYADAEARDKDLAKLRISETAFQTAAKALEVRTTQLSADVKYWRTQCNKSRHEQGKVKLERA